MGIFETLSNNIGLITTLVVTIAFLIAIFTGGYNDKADTGE